MPQSVNCNSVSNSTTFCYLYKRLTMAYTTFRISLFSLIICPQKIYSNDMLQKLPLYWRELLFTTFYSLPSVLYPLLRHPHHIPASFAQFFLLQLSQTRLEQSGATEITK